MDYKKYKFKFRLLVIHTDNYQNEKYKLNKQIYQDNIKEFHKRYVKLLVNRNKNNKFKIQLIGFDGSTSFDFNKIYPKKIFDIIDKMPMNDYKPKTNLSLYSDYDPKNTITGLGFKNKEKALYTINKIKNQPIKYQKSVVSTMIGRAKNHPHKNKDMEQAIKIFEDWLKKNKSHKD